MAQKLVNAQSIVAQGTHKMVVIHKGPPPEVETIRDEDRMQKLLDTGVYGVDYLIVAGSMPDAKAADMLLNRAFGKAKESLDLNVDVKFSLKDLAARRKGLKSDAEELPLIDVEVSPLEDGSTASVESPDTPSDLVE